MLGIASAPTLAHAHEGTGDAPCALSEEQRAAYEADGTLDARIAYQESLNNNQPTAGLITQALAREKAASGIAAFDLNSNVPSSWASGMASVGRAHVLAVRVSFPNFPTFNDGDTLEALQALIGPKNPGDNTDTSPAGFPYESLSAYYHRASYGKLTITGETFDYMANFDRDHYTNSVEDLFAEVAAALDVNQDLSRFDANGDGFIDAIYLHFSGGDTGWGSTWWSNERAIVNGALYENGTVALRNAVLLAGNSSDAWSARTMIHETGHVLGLPDYYSAASQTGGTSKRTGILTYDMMMQNLGDHNGYSKWLIGWLPDEKFTRVIANERGITVMRGGKVIEQHDADENGNTPAVTQTLAAYASDAADETGGIIVVQNENEGLFSSCYVLEYDAYAGNQSVRYSSTGAESEAANVPSGFRMFRVNGELSYDGETYKYSNVAGTVFNQMIELVDPDMYEPHSESSTYAPSATGQGTYRCMLFAGDKITPKGFEAESAPSTNFYENINVGFTGLTIEVTESSDSQGAVKISYSSEHKPSGTAEVEFTPTFDTFNSACQLTFETSIKLQLAPQSGLFARLIVDDASYPLITTNPDGYTVTTDCYLDPMSIKPGATCEIVYPAGMFIVAKVGDDYVYSPEVSIPLTPSATASNVELSGFYEGTGYSGMTPVASNVLTYDDSARRFVQLSDGTLKLHTINAENPTTLTSTTSEVVVPASLNAIEAALPLSGGKTFVALKSSDPGQIGLFCYWLDAEGDIEAQNTLENVRRATFVSHGKSVVASADWEPGPEGAYLPGGSLLMLMEPQSNAAATVRYGWTSYGLSFANQNCLAFCAYDKQGNHILESVFVHDAATLAAKLEKSTYTPGDANPENLCPDSDAATSISLNTSRGPLNIVETENGYCLLLSASYQESEFDEASLLMMFDRNGNEQARGNVPLNEKEGNYLTKVSVGEHGTVALSGTKNAAGGVSLTDTLFLDSETLEPLSSFTSAAASLGGWTADGRWLDLGQSVAAITGPKGSPIDPDDPDSTDLRPKIYYNITEPIDLAKPTPDDPTPEQPGTGEPSAGNGSSEGPALAQTGDPATHFTQAAMLAFGSAVAGLGAAAIARRSARVRK